MKHRWVVTMSIYQGRTVQRCLRCETERVKDTFTETLFLYRRGRAVPPSKKPLGEEWKGFVAGVVPKCPDKPGAQAQQREASPGRRQQLQVLAERFGGCGCRARCAVEEYGEDACEQKPNGRYSVCELEVGDLDVPLKAPGDSP